MLEKVGKMEASMQGAETLRDQKDYAGAWELLERAAQEMPDDPQLNAMRTKMIERASSFVTMLSDAQEMEKREQLGSSLALYLKAQKVYPASNYAKEGVDRLTRRILPTE